MGKVAGHHNHHRRGSSNNQISSDNNNIKQSKNNNNNNNKTGNSSTCRNNTTTSSSNNIEGAVSFRIYTLFLLGGFSIITACICAPSTFILIRSIILALVMVSIPLYFDPIPTS